MLGRATGELPAKQMSLLGSADSIHTEQLPSRVLTKAGPSDHVVSMAFREYRNHKSLVRTSLR